MPRIASDFGSRAENMPFDWPDVLALIAPRPIFIDSGSQDPQFHSKDARTAVRQLRPIYDLYEKPRSDLGIEVHNGAHQISGTRSIPWMLKQLKDA